MSEMVYCRCVLLLLFLICATNLSRADTHVLYDTKTEKNDLLWTLHPPFSGWDELSSLDTDGNTIRTLEVCNENEPYQNNWARSPFIDANHAKRIYIDIQYSILKNPEGRETFTLYYFTSTTDVATTAFPPWNENSYIKLDTITAGEQLESNIAPNGIINKTLAIDNLKRNGLYIAARDQGACTSLISLKLYYHYCPEITHNLTYFPKTAAGGMAASLVSVNGTCVSNAVEANNEEPKYRCNSDGMWTAPSGYCQCTAGYEASSNLKSCTVTIIPTLEPVECDETSLRLSVPKILFSGATFQVTLPNNMNMTLDVGQTTIIKNLQPGITYTFTIFFRCASCPDDITKVTGTTSSFSSHIDSLTSAKITSSEPGDCVIAWKHDTHNDTNFYYQIKVIPEFGSSSTFITYPAPYKIEQSVNVYEQLLVAGSTGVVKFEIRVIYCEKIGAAVVVKGFCSVPIPKISRKETILIVVSISPILAVLFFFCLRAILTSDAELVYKKANHSQISRRKKKNNDDDEHAAKKISKSRRENKHDVGRNLIYRN